ncbi:MAG TPA: ABC transporter permease subunit [Anaerolineae bacterium]|nr:ABC transporter permease subunit [Anaerolineae bacterium]HID85229.1 ABC transporter permease subunit [Anaerolineales bacterium]HIQ09071.1 ABC transporter permease subunit [Anaerolineaceae bacterium]
MSTESLRREGIPFWRDERVLQVLSQIIFLVVVVAVGYSLYRNMMVALAKQGLLPSFHWLKLTAGFDIGEHLISYSRASTYGRAFLVGILNTLLVSFLGIIFATLLGVIVGVARLSGNWLLSRLAAFYVEVLRNIPLLVLLVFWYTGLFLKLPRAKEAMVLPGPIYLSNRGVAIPWGIPTETFRLYLWVLLFAVVAAAIVAWRLTLIGKRTGRPPLVTLWTIVTFLVIAILGGLILKPLAWSFPELKGFNTVGGRNLTPEFAALLSGLVIYTSAYIGEVVRSGIQSVSKGQYEAARALGLNGFQTLRLVVFPQALRVIVPPLTSQYLNLTKNSSLAVYIGYPDLYSVAGTIHNQTGRAVEVTLMMMAVYLFFSLVTSLFMNWYNRKIRFVER